MGWSGHCPAVSLLLKRGGGRGTILREASTICNSATAAFLFPPCSGMLGDAFEMPWDVLGCSGMLLRCPGMLLRCPGMSWDALGCLEMPWDAFEMPWDALGCLGMLWDAFEMPWDAFEMPWDAFEMPWDALKSFKMLLRCPGMLWDALRCSEIIGDVFEMPWDAIGIL